MSAALLCCWLQSVDYDGELVLATLTESQMDYETRSARGTQGGSAGGDRATTGYIPGDTPCRNNGAALDVAAWVSRDGHLCAVCMLELCSSCEAGGAKPSWILSVAR